MFKTNVLKKTKTITFTSVPPSNSEYLGESFEYKQDETDAWIFVDWLKGGLKSPGPIGDFIVHEEEADTEFLNRRLTDTVKSYVEEKLLQRLQIHQGELQYRYESTADVGLPYLQKPTKDELDLFIKEVIVSTIGVKELTSFISRVSKLETNNRKSGYFAEFTVTTEDDEVIRHQLQI